MLEYYAFQRSKFTAKTFPALFDIVAAYCNKMLRDARTDYGRTFYGRALKRISRQKERYDSHKSQRKIPAELRKELREAEFLVLQSEPQETTEERHGARFGQQRIARLLEEVEQCCIVPRAGAAAKTYATTNARFEVGKAYLAQSITRAYDFHVWQVLQRHFVDTMPITPKGQRKTFNIKAPLPQREEYFKVRDEYFTRTLEVWIEGACGIIDDLRDEMESACESTPDSLQETRVFEARREAADALDELCSDPISVPPFVAAHRLLHVPSARRESRRERAAWAEGIMRAAARHLRECRTAQLKVSKRQMNALDEFCQHLDRHAAEISTIHFPGMYG